MKLVTFGIDDKRNLIVQFPVFVHPHKSTTPDFIPTRNSPSTNYRQKQKCTIIHPSTDY